MLRLFRENAQESACVYCAMFVRDERVHTPNKASGSGRSRCAKTHAACHQNSTERRTEREKKRGEVRGRCHKGGPLNEDREKGGGKRKRGSPDVQLHHC